MKSYLKLMLIFSAFGLSHQAFAEDDYLDGILKIHNGQMGLFYESPENGEIFISWINPKSAVGSKILKICKPNKFCQVMGKCDELPTSKFEGSTSECLIRSASKVKLNAKFKM